MTTPIEPPKPIDPKTIEEDLNKVDYKAQLLEQQGASKKLQEEIAVLRTEIKESKEFIKKNLKLKPTKQENINIKSFFRRNK